MTSRTQPDRGMTLIELLVGIVLTGVIMSALFGAMMMGLRTVDNTNDRISGSNDTQLIASYFTSDVSSAEQVSTTGTQSHSAPSVDAPGANSYYVAFWTLKANTAVTPPDSMTQAWQQQTAALTIESADEPLSATGSTGDRVATTALGTSSVNHAVAFAPALLSTISRSGVSTNSVANASGLTLTKPSTAANNDLLLAHVAVVGGSGTALNAPAGWTLLQSRDSGNAVKSLVYQHRLAAGESSWTWSFTPNRLAMGGILSYSGVATAGVGAANRGTNISPCGGETPALLLSWTDRGTNETTSVAYISAARNGENQLIRQRCAGVTGTPANESVLAHHLAANSVTAICSKATVCGPLPVSVTLTLSEPPPEHQSVGRSYELRAATRTTE